MLDIAGTCAAGLAAVGRHRPAVLLLDQRLPDGLGTSVLPEMLAASPGTKVLLVTASDSDEVLTTAIEAGAVGVITKGKRAFNLVAAVRAAANDEPVITPDDLRRLMPRLGQRGRRTNDTLTSREREVLDLLVAGKSTPDLAQALFVAPATARNHIQAIMTNSVRTRDSRRSPSPTTGRTGSTRTESGPRAGNLGSAGRQLGCDARAGTFRAAGPPARNRGWRKASAVRTAPKNYSADRRA